MPVDEQPELFEVLSTSVLVIEVIGMLPHIDSQQRCEPIAQRVIAIRQGLNLQFFGGVHSQENPTRTKEHDHTTSIG